MDTTIPLDLSAQFHDACVAYDLNLNGATLVNILDNLTKELTQNHDVRQQMGAGPHIWPDLRLLWRLIKEAQISSPVRDEETRASCVSLARFTRNLVAGVPANQVQAFENEPDIRRLLHYHTSWSAMQEAESFAATRILTQTLSNLITSNEALTSELWETYMALPEDQVVLIRLLASPDPVTILAVSVLVLNCIHGSENRILKLCTSVIGARVCVSLLDGMVKLYDAENSSDGARAFDVGYEIFTRIVEVGLVPTLYNKLAIEDEIITPSQTTLLKLLDSYLQTSQPTKLMAARTAGVTLQEQLIPMLSDSFLTLSTYAQQAILKALELPARIIDTTVVNTKRPAASAPTDKRDISGGVEVSTSVWFEESPEASDFEEFDKTSISEKSRIPSGSDMPPHLLILPAELDVSLPNVCEALVLVTQCIITITLETADGARPDTLNLKELFNNAQSEDGQGFIESLVELLRLLDLFLPRINFGKPVNKVTLNMGTAKPVQDVAGFSYVKRDLVRLLGILCHDTKAVQDRVRECGGIPIVMNLCVVDERNPYLREHAIFTLHNVLKGNRENQAVLDTIRPSGSWNENGVLQK